MLLLRLLLMLPLAAIHFFLVLRRRKPDEDVDCYQRKNGTWVRSYRRSR